jgi:hypothetical protein
MEEMAERLDGMGEELTDMAMDALRRATSGDPDSLEAGEALALEKRLNRVRRSVEKAASVLRERGRAGGSVDDMDLGAEV